MKVYREWVACERANRAQRRWLYNYIELQYTITYIRSAAGILSYTAGTNLLYMANTYRWCVHTHTHARARARKSKRTRTCTYIYIHVGVCIYIYIYYVVL